MPLAQEMNLDAHDRTSLHEGMDVNACARTILSEPKFLGCIVRGVTALTGAVSGEKQIIPGIWKFCRESGNLGSFSGKMRYFRGIEQRFDITCYHTIYMHSDMHPVYVLYFMYFDT